MSRVWVPALALACIACEPALADATKFARYRPYHWYALPPERHVIEVVQPPYSGNFIVNGTRFTAKSAACLRWVAGERIRLLAGDWHGHAAYWFGPLLGAAISGFVWAKILLPLPETESGKREEGRGKGKSRGG